MNINSIIVIIQVILIIVTIVLFATGLYAIIKDYPKILATINLIIATISLFLTILSFTNPAKIEEWINSLPWESSNEGSTEVVSTTKETDEVDEPTEETDVVDEPTEEKPEERVFPRVIPANYYVYEGHTYGFYNADNLGLDSYRKVSEFCREQGGHLATINSQRENSFLFETLRNNYVNTAFFGYSDEIEERNWQWDYESSSYTNWTEYGRPQPDDGAPHGTSEDYAEFNYDGNKEPSYKVPSDGTWNDAVFKRNTNLFICEWEFDVEKELNNN